jgi:excisionase family DNA binding protein
MNRIIEIGNIDTNTMGGDITSVLSAPSDCAELIPYKLLSITQVAHMLGVGKDTVYNLLHSGQLGFIEIGKRKKVPMMAINNYITQNTKYQTKSERNNRLDDKLLESILYPNHKKMKSIDGGKILERIMRIE